MFKKNKEKVSCIITTFNRASLLSRAIFSVTNQTYQNVELIIIDDNSSDDTKEIVSGFSDPRIVYIKNKKNLGLSGARNIGAELATGEYVAFLDDDDEWKPDKIEKQLDVFRNSEFLNLGLVYTWMTYMSTEEVFQKLQPVAKGSVFEKAIDDQPIAAGSTWMITKKVFESGVWFDEEIPRGVDGDFVRQLSLKFEVDYVSECLVDYFVDHEHTRMTNSSKGGVERAIVGQEITLRKFDEQIRRYPDRLANLMSITAYDYVKIGSFKNASIYFIKAFRVSLLSIVVYKNLIKSFLFVLGLKNGS